MPTLYETLNAPTKDAEVSGETIAFPAEPQRTTQRH